jgi:hypothetical protein
MITREALPFGIMNKIRLKIITWTGIRFDDDDSYTLKWSVYNLVTCAYCLGVWISILLSVAYLYPNNWTDTLLLVLGIAGGQSALQSLQQE